MSKPTQSTNEVGYVNALLVRTRLTKESLETNHSPQKDDGSKVQITINASSRFVLSLDNDEHPSTIRIEINGFVEMKKLETDVNLVTYSASHVAEFKISSCHGFSDWKKVPVGALDPYFAMIQSHALSRAEAVIFDVGWRGIKIPPPPLDTLKYEGNPS